MGQLQAVLDRIIQGFATLLDRAPGAFANPRAYPQEAIVIAASAALLLVLLVLMILVTVDFVGRRIRSRRQGLRVRHASHVGLARAAAVVSVLAALAFVLVVAPVVPAAGRLCGSCHATRQPVVAWEADAHSGVSCYGCHARRGLLGVVQAGAEGIASVGRAEETSETHAPVFESRCLGCHHDIDEGVTSGTVRMRHSDVIEAGYACLTCHPAVGHSAMERPALPITRSRMNTCLGCHDGDTASSACLTCHDRSPSDTPVASPPAASELSVHCDGCHAAETRRKCVACHGLELPHPEAFAGQHAGASWNDPGLCVRCHEEAGPGNGCDCHGEDTNIHGTYNEWFPAHAQYATTMWPGGCSCHADSFCLFCHEQLP